MQREAETRALLKPEYSASLMLACFLALVVWLSAVTRARPIKRLVLPGPESEERISIEFFGLPEGRAWYLPDQRSVKVTLRGTESGLAGISALELVARADLSNVDESSATVQVEVEARCRRPLRCMRQGIRVVEVRPSRISVRIGSSGEASRDVSIEADADPPLGYVLVKGEIEPGRVNVLGAKAQIDRVETVAARVFGVSRLTHSTQLEHVLLVPMDAFGRDVDDVSVMPATVDVELTISRQGEPVYVLAGFTGAPAEGYRVVGFEVEPQSVQLSGPSDQVESLRNRLAPSVSVSGITKDLIQRVPLQLPPGVEAVNAPDGITITVRIKPLQGTRVFDLELQIAGIGRGLGAALNPERVRVLLGGAQPILDELDSGEIVAEVDLSDLGPGRQRVMPRLILPEGVREISITPSEIEVSLANDDDDQSRAPSRSPRRALAAGRPTAL